ncbi:rubredoxin-NAD(+) reductase [Janthinobacterium agaricidamnosum NBRC 102515 = DSM 9628]|uniref:Rubredoxin-NAD(+) reductase n=3 Tax=Janthinobacterium agaricidamnosum TaxID=55508 RepID=W0V853_9BURK|nr:FAD-dependent oxidoreductase [Janthinobacterium agaricidamnosum]CDG83805.1 rubredoxin-NAD(+) reductase [Janthinobacterium agaricidamnosum NBRC 102515 = DSM 9628]
MATFPIVIIGAGMAAYSLAREVRKRDQTTRLLIVSADSADAYPKPMLSNAFALNKEAQQLVSHSAAQMAAQLDAEILDHTRVTAIDSARQIIRTERGEYAYEKLVLALGAQAIRLPLAGDGADQVLSINHLDDYAGFRAQLAKLGRPARIAILGAGLIGSEFAEDLSSAGHHVTLVDPNPRPLSALAAPALSLGLTAAWRGRSIALQLNTSASGVYRTPSGMLEVTLGNGEKIDADIVLSAVGLRPAIALAQAAGLSTGRGIIVDQFGQTSVPGIYALGDCAEYASAGGSAVLPYVAPLMTAARAIAATLSGTATAIAFKAEAVIVKTPSYTLALSPPLPGVNGRWSDEHDGERTVSRFIDEQGVLRGFGLSQHTPALHASLLADLHRGVNPSA